jgi:hypothetical protein
VSLAAVGVQMCVNLWLLRREFDRKLGFAPLPAPVAVAASS